MRASAALVLAVAFLATACGGGKPPATAAAVAPADAVAYLSLGTRPEPAESRRALAFLPGGSSAQALLDRVAWARIEPDADVAVLGPQSAVAYALPHDRAALERRLDGAGLLHARVRGWTAFTPSATALAAAKRARTRLAGTAWFPAALRAAGGQPAILRRGGGRWSAIALDGGTVRQTLPGGGPADGPHGLAARIPANAVFAAASHDFAGGLRGLPYAQLVERGVGLKLADLARATPGSAVLYGSASEPFATLTLLAAGGSLAAGARVARELDPVAPPAVPVELDGVTLQHAAFGAVDLYYGREEGSLVLTDDPGLDLRPTHHLEPRGLPRATAAWVYLDAERGPPALESLATLAGAQLSGGFLAKVAGLRSVLAYETSGRSTRSTVVTVTGR